MIKPGKTFWTILVGINTTSLMLSAFAGSLEAIFFCSFSLAVSILVWILWFEL